MTTVTTTSTLPSICSGVNSSWKETKQTRQLDAVNHSGMSTAQKNEWMESKKKENTLLAMTPDIAPTFIMPFQQIELQSASVLIVEYCLSVTLGLTPSSYSMQTVSYCELHLFLDAIFGKESLAL